MNVQPTSVRRSEVDVDLHGMGEGEFELAAEMREGLPVPVQCLQNDRRSISEVCEYAARVDEVVDVS